MITLLLPFAGIPILLLLYLFYLMGITRPENKAIREGLEQTFAVNILKHLEGRHITSTHDRLPSIRDRRDHDRDFMQAIMPWMFEEAQNVTRASRRPLALWRFGTFCAVYFAIWMKVRVRPSAWDLRYLAGAELPLLRRPA